VRKPYSVLLLYPDTIAENYGEETYYTFVWAVSVKQAVKMAQCLALVDNDLDEEQDPDAFRPLLVIEGHHQDQLTETIEL
jgi:hypothetical protein